MSWLVDNHYARLGVARDATPEEIRRAYHELARKLHPDTNTDADATDDFIRLQQAYEVLSKPEAKAKYDLTLPPEEEPDIKVTVSYSRNTLLQTSNPQLLYVMLEIEPVGEIVEREAPPLNLCLVLDRSTSMKGKRMDVLKDATNKLIGRLRPIDYLSVVAFSDRAEVVVPANRDVDASRITGRMSLIQPGGGTEIYHGLKAGVEQVLKNANSSYINHIILITDGHTYGDEDKCLELAAEANQNGLTISGLGIGKEWNDNFIDKLTNLTGGNSMYVSQAKDIKRFLELKFSELNRTYAEKVELLFQLNPVVELRYAFRLQPELAKLESSEGAISLGNIHHEKPFEIIFELLLNEIPQAGDSFGILKGTLEMDIPTKITPRTNFKTNWKLSVVREAETEPPPQKIVQAMSRLTLYRMQEQARQDVSEGNFEAATRRLKNLATQLLSKGEKNLATVVLTEASRLEQGNLIDLENEKAIKYGTRALLLPAGLEDSLG